MKRFFLLLCLLSLSLAATAQSTLIVLDSVVFHDGYAAFVPDTSLSNGVVKLRNDLFARKLTAVDRRQIGTKTTIRVVIKALCDNYDRMASVNLALVPKGLETYQPDSVQHLELGRFITPFMSKNVLPDTVSYTFEVDNLAFLLKDKVLASNFDAWLELSVFGIPYAAQKQVAGCLERNDVFQGRLELHTNVPAPEQKGNFLMPLLFKHPFNNYAEGATDTLGKTSLKTVFTFSKRIKDVRLYWITSNHGANEGGEEYIRRNHYVWVDGVLRCTYKPGRASCEPFRVHNTQRNGIYGKEPMSDEDWQSFSNWCPGDVIDIHRIDLGALSEGEHCFMIQVPEAVFQGKQGDFPLSVYIQGKE